MSSSSSIFIPDSPRYEHLHKILQYIMKLLRVYQIVSSIHNQHVKPSLMHNMTVVSGHLQQVDQHHLTIYLCCSYDRRHGGAVYPELGTVYLQTLADKCLKAGVSLDERGVVLHQCLPSCGQGRTGKEESFNCSRVGKRGSPAVRQCAHTISVPRSPVSSKSLYPVPS